MLGRDLQFFQWRCTSKFVKKQDSIVHGRMELLDASPQAIELNASCLEQVYSNRFGTSHEYKSPEPRCILTVLQVPSIIRPLRIADASSGKVVSYVRCSLNK